MSRRAVASAAAIATLFIASPVDAERAPNILLLVAEDLSSRVGAFDDEVARTPNLDRLAAEGVLFTRLSSVSAQTAPSVASLFSGLYPSETGVQFYPADLSFGE